MVGFWERTEDCQSAYKTSGSNSELNLWEYSEFVPNCFFASYLHRNFYEIRSGN